jgi:hypothetical protein
MQNSGAERLKYIFILSYHLCVGLPSGLFPSVLPTKTLKVSRFPYVQHAAPTSYLEPQTILIFICFLNEGQT